MDQRMSENKQQQQDILKDYKLILKINKNTLNVLSYGQLVSYYLKQTLPCHKTYYYSMYVCSLPSQLVENAI